MEVEAAGSGTALDALRDRLRQGPPGARVTRLDEQELATVPDWNEFVIDH